MPTYDYKCLECNYTFEEFQKMTDDPLEVCPSCNGKLKRLIGSGAAPIFQRIVDFIKQIIKMYLKQIKLIKLTPKPDTKKTVPKSRKVKKTDLIIKNLIPSEI